MKHIACLFAGVVCSATLLLAQDASTAQKKSGTICNSKCVVQEANAPTCDPTCTDKSGNAVFVDDQGKVMQISNQNMAMPKMGQHVKMTCVPTEKQRETSLRIMEYEEEAP